MQLDLEWDEIDAGVDPSRPRPYEVSAPNPNAARVFTLYEIGSPTNFKKLRNLDDFDFIADEATPRLYTATGDKIAAALGQAKIALIEEIDQLTSGRAVIRTDIEESLGRLSLNSARTDTVDGEQAAQWLERQLGNFGPKLPDVAQLAFILHAFLPAEAGAWAYANPGEPIAFVDALWGLPDGLQVLPHDSYQVDVVRQLLLTERVRFKPRFLCERQNGTWEYVDVSRSKGRISTLPIKDVVEIGIRTARIAARLGERAQIMWFCGVPLSFGVGRNLPWYRAREVIDPAPRQAPKYRPFRVRGLADLHSVPQEPITIRLDPDAELIRSEEFLDEVIAIALARRLPVEIQGSTLSHTYYRLAHAGVVVNPTDLSKYYRTRGKRSFGKLVRDLIPDQIKSGGERVLEARLAPSDLRAALAGKLFEEALEYLNSRDASGATEELADLLEIVIALATAAGLDWNRVDEAAKYKRVARGGFMARRVLLETSLARPGEPNDRIPEVRLRDLSAPGVRDEQTAVFPFGLLVEEGGASVVLGIAERSVRVSAKFDASGLRVALREEHPAVDDAVQLGLFDIDE